MVNTASVGGTSTDAMEAAVEDEGSQSETSLLRRMASEGEVGGSGDCGVCC